MSRIKEWWLDRSKKWKIVIIVVVAGIVLGAGGTFGLLEVFKRVPRACSFCHSQAVYVDSYYESEFMDNAHAVLDPPVKCKDCHHATLVQLTKELITNITGDFETPLVQREYEQEFCTGCHPPDDVFDATVKANRPEFITNPHWNHEPGGSSAGDAAIVECQECHRAHRGGINFCFENCHGSGYGYAPFQ